MTRPLCSFLAWDRPCARPGKEMEAIRAANFLFDRDPHGGAWIEFNKQAPKAGHEGRGRAGRTGGRRRR